MRLTLRDLVATVLFAIIGVWYVGYLVNGSMPLAQDARGMSAIGIVLGVIGYVVLRSRDTFDRAGKAEVAVASVSLALGVIAFAAAEAAAAGTWLAIFMVSLLVVWAVEEIDHSGLVHMHDRTVHV